MCIFATDMKIVLYISVFFLLLASCTGDREVMPVLERAEAYLPEYPNSAGMLLDSISSRPIGNSSERVRALYGLLRTMTDAMTGKGVTTDSLIRPAYIYYKEQGESDEHTRRLGRSAFYLARYEASRDSTKQAEDLYREAIHYSEQVEDWRTCYLAYTSMARILSKANVAKGIEHGKKALQVYGRIKDKPSNLIIILHDLCYDYINIQQMDSALYYAQVALDVVNNNDIELQYKKEALKALSSVYYYLEDYKQAVFYAKLSMADYESFSDYPLIYNLAECYLACDSIQQAERLLLQLRCSSNYEESYVAYRDLTRIAIIRHQQKLAELYTDSACSMLEQMYYKSLSQKDVYYDNLIIQKVHEEQLKTEKEQIKFRYICITLVLIITIYILIRWSRKKIKRISEKRRNSVYAHKKSMNYFSKLIRRYDKFLVRKDRIIEVQEHNIERMQLYHIKRTHLYISLMNGSLNKNIISKHTMEEMEELLNEYSSDFVKRLKTKYPNITDSQLELCMLMRIGMSRKQLSKFYLRSEESIRTWQRSLKQTVFGIKESKPEISEIIANF